MTYSNPNVNPFKTLPKDAPARSGKDGQSNRTTPGGYNNSGGQGGQNNFGGNGSYRGRTPGYNASRGNMAMGGNFNRNFSGPPIGGMNGNFQAPMGGIQGGMGGNFGGFNRGGMMANMRGGGSMRGGRGGMNNGMMGGMPMGGMGGIGGMGGMGGMNGMGGPMSMGNMAGGMQGMMNSNLYQGPGARAATHFNENKNKNKRVSKRHTSQISFSYQTPVPAGSYNPSFFGTQSAQSQTSFSTFPISNINPFQQTEVGAKQQISNTGAGFGNAMPHFNPAFFQQNQAASGGGDGWQNPHGAKRPRPE